MPQVKYVGASRREDRDVGAYEIDGVLLKKGEPTEVDAKLAKELTEGSERTKFHRFEAVQEKSTNTAPPKPAQG